MIEAIDKERIEHQFHLWAYGVMPEHVRLLICPTQDDYSLSAILKSMKQFVLRKAIHSFSTIPQNSFRTCCTGSRTAGTRTASGSGAAATIAI